MKTLDEDNWKVLFSYLVIKVGEKRNEARTPSCYGLEVQVLREGRWKTIEMKDRIVGSDAVVIAKAFRLSKFGEERDVRSNAILVKALKASFSCAVIKATPFCHGFEAN
eukprot:gene10916-12076_t